MILYTSTTRIKNISPFLFETIDRLFRTKRASDDGV